MGRERERCIVRTTSANRKINVNTQRWDKLKLAFARAYDAGGELDAAALADDPELRGEVEALLAENAAAGDMLESPGLAVLSGTTLRGELACEHGADSDDEASTLMNGQRVGGYTIQEMIGRGGMGEVYRAIQEHPRRAVALKVIRAGLASRRAIKRLEIEAAILARLDHAGIARIIEAGELRLPDTVGTFHVRPFFSMELVPGVPITRHAEQHGLDVRARVELMRLVCDAVEHAHRRGVIHRDLKPGNILVDEHGRPRVLDFGVARVVDREAGMTLTHAGIMPGTLAYMSPEQAGADAEAVDTRSDVYALGVILYELLSGKLPVDAAGRSAIEMLRAIREDVPRKLGIVRRELRGELEAIVMAALSKDPVQRYASASALRDDLDRYLRREPLLIKRPSAGYLLKVFARRRWREMTVAGIALAVGLSFAGWQMGRALRAERLAEQRLADIRRNASELVTDLISKLWSFKSITEARSFLAGEAMQRLERLASESGDDPETLWSLSRAYRELGMATGHPGVPNAGKRDEAVSLLRRALELGERVIEMTPGKTDQELAVAHIAAGLAQIVPDRIEANRLIKRSISMYERAVRQQPENTLIRHDLAYKLMIDGSLCAEAGEPYAASFERSEAILNDVVALNPDEMRWVETLGSVYSAHARAIHKSDLDASISVFVRAHQLMVEVQRAQPSNYSAIRHISIADAAIAQQHATRGRLEEASTLVDRTVRTHRDWFAKEPANSVYRLDLVDSIIAAARVGLLVSPSTMTVEEVRRLVFEARELIFFSRGKELLNREELSRLTECDQLEAKLRDR